MRAYIVRRLLLMVPTLFGVTLVCFLIMKIAPGDPLKLQLSQAGSQGESSTTREAFLHQRRQWKLDRPTFLNYRWFTDSTAQIRRCAFFQSLAPEEFRAELDRLAALPPSSAGQDENFRFLEGLDIESFADRLRQEDLREEFSKVVRVAVQIATEDIGDYGVESLAALLREPGDVKTRIGAVRALSVAMLGDPFVYTYSKDPDPDETEAVVSTWKIWWERDRNKHPAVPADRLPAVEGLFRKLVQEPSRGKILEGVKAFATAEGKFRDAAFFMDVLLRDSGLKEKYVASIVLRSWMGKPLRVDVRLTDTAAQVDPVAANWLAYISSHPDRFDPSFGRRLARFFTETQYANSLAKLVTFDFGKSMLKPYDPVGPKIWAAVKVTAPIMLVVEILVYLFAVPLGILCAVRRGKATDRIVSLQLFMLYSLPSVVAGMLFLTFFCYGQFLKIFPSYGLASEGHEAMTFLGRLLDYARHLVGPVLILATAQLAYLAQYTRSSLLDVVNQDYVRTARAKGLTEATVILKHALRNALIPVITLFASFIPALLGGSVIIEFLFGIPGMGRLSFESINAKDYNTVMAIVYIDAIVVLLSILLSDFLYLLVDPRISFEKAEAKS